MTDEMRDGQLRLSREAAELADRADRRRRGRRRRRAEQASTGTASYYGMACRPGTPMINQKIFDVWCPGSNSTNTGV